MRVLVVDDDFMVAKVHSGYVERIEGCTVVGVAHRGAEALELAGRLRPDLVLLDVYLPDLSGLEVLSRLRTGVADDPFVLVVTAADDPDTIAAALHGGALHYLVKPFDSAALAAQVHRASRTRRELGRVRDQSDIDRLFGTAAAPTSGGAGTPERMPKGLTTPTADLVVRALRAAAADGAEDLSASECAQATELSRVSARRYLEHFVATGVVAVRLRYGGTGRPERRYRWVG
ncbi:Response regulator of citrate/malate metabolism [Pseudonocardia ammonioxydans]|uniref:Transcriptional regulatory protein n=1 Tax=Pseudonocardia ammonioxydans TaxID=260086 RepID=A0A1I4W334_PSUAM|nr:response regulator [Pseudonocardia ammonioxydans]SFN07958.1 Response regulator of citrate/malate metabolism [Pseudonocardia ammonioxydans]